MTTRTVLVPGFWLGQWAWDGVDGVVPALRERGFDVVAVTLLGWSLNRHAGAPVTLADQAAAIEAALDVDVERRILVATAGRTPCSAALCARVAWRLGGPERTPCRGQVRTGSRM